MEIQVNLYRQTAIHLVLLASACIAAAACSGPDSSPDEAVAVVVGPDGGTVEGAEGASVQVPEGALDEDVEIDVDTVSEDEVAAPLPEEMSSAGTLHRFTPHGTTFLVPVTLELPHDGSANVVLRLDDESDTTWETVEGAQFDGERVTLEVTSFSIYGPAAVCENACGPGSDGLSCAGCGDGASCDAASSDGSGYSCECCSDGTWSCDGGCEDPPDTGDTDPQCENECGPDSAGLSCEGCGVGASCDAATSDGSGYSCECCSDGTWSCDGGCEDPTDTDEPPDDTDIPCANACGPDSDGLSCTGCGTDAACAGIDADGNGFDCQCCSDGTWRCDASCP